MSRVVNIITSPSGLATGVSSLSTEPMDQTLLVPFGESTAPEEAAPFYTSISTRLRYTGFDGTATWTRIDLEPDLSDPSIANGDGLDNFPALINATGTDCHILVQYDALSELSFHYFRDPQKQRVWFFGSSQLITSGAITDYVYCPFWFVDSALSPARRNPYRYFGMTNARVDTSGWSATKWRDLRGTYSATDSVNGYQYDWTIG